MVKYYKKKFFKEKKIQSLKKSLILLKKYSCRKFNESLDISVIIDLKKNKNVNIVNCVKLPYLANFNTKILVFLSEDQRRYKLEIKKLYNDVKVIILKENLSKNLKKYLKCNIVISSLKALKFIKKISSLLSPRNFVLNENFGTITDDVLNSIKDFKKNKIIYKSDKYGVINSKIGDLILENKKLENNFIKFINSVKYYKTRENISLKIKRVYLTTTMGLSFIIKSDFF
ncbi:MAG: hypothetical protein ACG0KC_00675 [Enterobacteriaceae bacterium]